ncbi:type III secretion system effector arginine glycosyltransferase NleB, partial [Escherichia coli]|nr:type III secretion system effector arginine glycosyltransferase NleB [Escherichia coli]
EARPERYEKGEVPILNTKEHPYLSNIINAAKIENERIIGVLVDGNFTYEQKKEFLSLENEYQNIKIIYRADVDFSMYDKKLSDIYLENIHKQESYPASERDNYLLGLLREELKNIPEGKDSLIESYAKKREHTWFDFF